MTSTELLAPDQTCASPPLHFDYDALEPETAAEARATADHLRSLCMQQNEAILVIGRELGEIKAKLGHGHWMAWLRAEFNMSVQTAERCIRVAETLPEKIVTMTNLRPTRSVSIPNKPPGTRKTTLENVRQPSTKVNVYRQ